MFVPTESPEAFAARMAETVVACERTREPPGCGWVGMGSDAVCRTGELVCCPACGLAVEATGRVIRVPLGDIPASLAPDPDKEGAYLVRADFAAVGAALGLSPSERVTGVTRHWTFHHTQWLVRVETVGVEVDGPRAEGG